MMTTAKPEEPSSRVAPTLAYLGTSAAPGLASKALMHNLLTQSDVSSAMRDKLIELSKLDIGYRDPISMWENISYRPSPADGFQHGTVVRGHRGIPTSSLAHELGHGIEHYGKGRLAGGLSRLSGNTIRSAFPVSALLAIAGIMSGDQKEQRQLLNASSIAGGTMMAPTLLNEYRASRNAFNLLRQLPPAERAQFLGEARRILPRAFGTYGLAAAGLIAAPQIAKAFMRKEASWLGTAGRVALGALPVLGGLYEGYNAVDAFRQGRWGSGLGHAALAGLSFIPGAGVLGGLGKGLGKALFRGGMAAGRRGLVGAGANLARAGAGLRAGGQVAERGAQSLMSAPGLTGRLLRGSQTLPGSLAQGAGAIGLGTLDANAAGRQLANRQAVDTGYKGLKALGNFAQQQGVQNPMYAQPSAVSQIPGILGAY